MPPPLHADGDHELGFASPRAPGSGAEPQRVLLWLEERRSLAATEGFAGPRGTMVG